MPQQLYKLMMLFFHYVKNKIKVFRGHQQIFLKDIMIAQKYNIQNIVRITSDCPLMDPEMIDQMKKIQ